VLAGIHKKKMGFDDVLLLNQEGFLCEALSSNIFVHYEKTLYTPAISEGCIEGVMRRVVIDMATDEGIEVVEAQISPQIMKEAEEIFLTNAVQGVQWVMITITHFYFKKDKIKRSIKTKFPSFLFPISNYICMLFLIAVLVIMWITGMKVPVELIPIWMVLLYISYLLVKKNKSKD